MTLLQYFLFVALGLLIPVSYEDKRFAHYRTTHKLTHPLTSGIHETKQAY